MSENNAVSQLLYFSIWQDAHAYGNLLSVLELRNGSTITRSWQFLGGEIRADGVVNVHGACLWSRDRRKYVGR